MLRHILVLAAGLMLFACGSGDGITPPITIDPEGKWSGTFQADSQDVSLTLQLTETSGAVTGNGTLVTSAGSFPLTVDGSYTKPRLSLGITTPGFRPGESGGPCGGHDHDGDDRRWWVHERKLHVG